MPKSNAESKPYIPETVANGEGGLRQPCHYHRRVASTTRKVGKQNLTYDEAVEEAVLVDRQPAQHSG